MAPFLQIDPKMKQSTGLPGCEPTEEGCETTGEPVVYSTVAPSTTEEATRTPSSTASSTQVDPVEVHRRPHHPWKRKYFLPRLTLLTREQKRQEEEEMAASEELHKANRKYDEAMIHFEESFEEQAAAVKRLRDAQNRTFSTRREIHNLTETMNAYRAMPTTTPQGCEPTWDQCEATGEPTPGSPVAPTTTGSTLSPTCSHSTDVGPVDPANVRMELLLGQKKEQDVEQAFAKEAFRIASIKLEQLDLGHVQLSVKRDQARLAEHRAAKRLRAACAATEATKVEIADLTEKMNGYGSRGGNESQCGRPVFF